MNCLDFGDPYHDKELRAHKGTHPKTLLGIAEQATQKQREPIIEHLMNWRANRAHETDLCVVNVCKRERHRSIGERYLCAKYVKENHATWPLNSQMTEVISKIDVISPAATGNYSKMCPDDCPACTHATVDFQVDVNRAYEIYKTKMDDCIRSIVHQDTTTPGGGNLPSQP